MAGDTAKFQKNKLPGAGSLVAGRFSTDQSNNYATFMLDELLLFNNTLTAEDVNKLYNL